MSDTPPAIPRHVAIIMDGNGRWARRHGLPRIKGHEEGANSVHAVVEACRQVGVKYLTLYAFSTENWKRPPDEVAALMNLLVDFLRTREPDLHKNRIRLRVTGRLQDLPLPVQVVLKHVMAATAAYDQGQLILALSYGAREELAQAARAIARRVRDGDLAPDDITEETVTRHLYLPDVPDPDLMIRTSGEIRLSNFLLWELSYAEFYFTDILWPDFREAAFLAAIEEYGRRQRRFGESD